MAVANLPEKTEEKMRGKRKEEAELVLVDHRE
jgi:hypothetical protein